MNAMSQNSNAMSQNSVALRGKTASSVYIESTARPQHTAHLQHKVEEDVAFLTNRIDMMKKNTRPNQNVLDTYETMLKSRKAVLAWLCDGQTTN